MRDRSFFLAGAITLLAVGLLVNGVALFLAPGPGAPIVMPAARANSGVEGGPGYYVLGRDTYLITSSQGGDKVYLWHYDFSPMKNQNELEFVTYAAAR